MSTIYRFKTGNNQIPRNVLREPEQCYNSVVIDPLDDEQQRRADKQRLANFCLMDDTFMSSVFDGNKECTQLLLRLILERNDLVVLSAVCQKFLPNLQRHSVYLDILCRDAEGRIYNIEVQRADEGADPRRARYHSGLIDADILRRGKDYDELAESYVIVITENDVMGGGLPIYHVDRYVRETGEVFNDLSHIIYVNSQVRDDTALGRLMHDFWCTRADDMHYQVLADRVRHFKEKEEGIAAMCKTMEDMRNEVDKAVRIQTARKLIIRNKDSHEDIADLTGLSLEEIDALAEKQTA